MTKKFVLNFILSAICYVALGIALIVWPATSINVFCYVLGGVTAAYGLWQVYRFISHREERYATLSLMVGIVALALGICFFVKPELFASILPFILGLYLIFDGVVKLQAAIDIKKDGYQKWGILLLLAVLMIALGVVILLNPFQSAQVLITFIGICMLLDGVINLWNAFVVWQHLRALKKAASACRKRQRHRGTIIPKHKSAPPPKKRRGFAISIALSAFPARPRSQQAPTP